MFCNLCTIKPANFLKMVPKAKNQNQRGLFFSFSDTLNQQYPLYILANMVQWEVLEKAFAPRLGEVCNFVLAKEPKIFRTFTAQPEASWPWRRIIPCRATTRARACTGATGPWTTSCTPRGWCAPPARGSATSTS